MNPYDQFDAKNPYDRFDKPKAAPKPKGYQKARQRLERRDQVTRDANTKVAGNRFGNLLNAGNDWQAQVARNTGAMDEIGGAINYVTQGGENIFRRLTGQEIEIPAATAGRAAMDHEREQQARYAKEKPGRNALAWGATIATSARPTAGLFTNPLAAGGAAAAQNAPFALARQEGSLRERVPGAAAETALTFGVGAGLQAGSNALSRGAQAARANPSPQRILSGQGVDLTPGQMAGGVFQRAEDAATSVPILGDAVRTARVRGIESFDRTAINRTLAPVNATLAPNANVGREGVQAASDAISDAYNVALNPVRVVPDAQYANDIAGALNVPNLPAAIRQELQDISTNSLAGRMGQGVDGRTWKAVDEELGAMYRAADTASGTNPTARYLRDGIGRLQQAHAALLERTDPAAAAAVRNADEAFANLVRVRRASQYTGTSARGGVFSPADLNRAVQGTDTSAGNRAFAQGNALMQDLTDPAMRVLPQQVPDSGTPFRSLLTVGGLSGGGMTLGAAPEAVIGGVAALTAGAGVYSQPVQRVINAIYRAKTPGAAREALSRLAQLAARDPALVPAYEEAARRLGAPLPPRGGQPTTQRYQPEPTTP